VRGCALRSSVARLLLAGAALALAAACEIEKETIPYGPKFLALHGVLSASASSQVVLLERTRNGSLRPVAPSFELESPLGSDSGIAESGATVSLVTPTGERLFATEDNIGGGARGEGVYRFYLPGSALERNTPYRLEVRTRDGEVLGAETSVPGGAPAMVADSMGFDRSADALEVTWPSSPGASSYFVRVETPFGPRAFFTSDTTVRLPGDLRNVDLDALPHVFIPGFPQAVTVSAVDSNYYDWFRTHADPLSGRGLVDRVEGGLGVFGAIVRLRLYDLDVTAPQPEPIAGTFDLVGPPEETATQRYLQLHLYEESHASRSDQPDALSGRAVRRVTFTDPGCPLCGVLGSVKDGTVELQFLSGWSASDTADTFTGELRGDTIVGTYRIARGVARFVKRR
jgi:hypothetical protein